MAERLGEAVLELSTDDHRLTAGLSRARSAVHGLGETFMKVGRIASIGAALPIAEIARMGMEKLTATQSVMAQTTRVSAALGKQSGLTAGYIEESAVSLRNLSGVADENIQAGQNLLLTLVDIPKGTEAGRKAFNNMSLDMANLAAVMHVDMPAAAKQLSRAIGGDLSKGTMKVGRVSFALTAAQKKLAEHFKATGDQAGKLALVHQILTEHMGGAAKAAGGTLASKVAILKDQFATMAAKLLEQLIPAFMTLMHYAEKGFAAFDKLSPSVKHAIAVVLALAVAAGPVALVLGGIAEVMEVLVGVVGFLLTPVGLLVAAVAVLGVMWLRTGDNMKVVSGILATASSFVRQLWADLMGGKKAAGPVTQVGAAAQRTANIIKTAAHGIQIAMAAVSAFIATQVAPKIKQIMGEIGKTLTVWFGWAGAAWKRWGGDITKFASVYLKYLVTVFKTELNIVRDIIVTILRVLRGDWSGAWQSLKKLASDALHGVVAIVKSVGPLLEGAAKLAFKMIVSAAVAVLSGLGKAVVGAVRAGINAIAGLDTWVYGLAQQLGQKIVDGVLNAISGLGNKVASAVKSSIPGPLQHIMGIKEGGPKSFAYGVNGVLTQGMSAMHAGIDTQAVQAQAKADALQHLADLSAKRDKAAHSLDTKRQKAANRALTRYHNDKSDTAAERAKKAADLRTAQRLAAAAARTHTAAVAQHKAATAQQAAATAAQKAAAALQASADRLVQGIANITTGADLKDAMYNLAVAMNGGVETDAMHAQHLSDLKAEFSQLQAELVQNNAQMNDQQRIDLMNQMTAVQTQINEASPSNPSGSTGDTVGSGGQPPVTLIFNGADPEIWSATRAAQFAVQTAGLAGTGAR